MIRRLTDTPALLELARTRLALTRFWCLTEAELAETSHRSAFELVLAERSEVAPLQRVGFTSGRRSPVDGAWALDLSQVHVAQCLSVTPLANAACLNVAGLSRLVGDPGHTAELARQLLRRYAFDRGWRFEQAWTTPVWLATFRWVPPAAEPELG